MRRIASAFLVIGLAACGSGTPQATPATAAPAAPVSTVTTEPAPATTTLVSTTQPPATMTPPSAPPTTGPAAPLEPTEPSEAELAAFIATVDDLVTGTVYEGGAVNEPELFLATGWLMCDWLDAGDGPDDALARYLEELAGSVEAADDDQLVLAGALLGAAVGVLCPRHAASVAG